MTRELFTSIGLETMLEPISRNINENVNIPKRDYDSCLKNINKISNYTQNINHKKLTDEHITKVIEDINFIAKELETLKETNNRTSLLLAKGRLNLLHSYVWFLSKGQ